ncbi:MAG: hypothetical protein RIQ65_277 [Pseudomonadota bacterium]|jgi:large subunit ribosomal protein L14
MIQNGTYLNTIDNSGARKVACIKVLGGYRRRYAKLGDKILVSIKTLRTKRRSTVKVLKGEMHHALIVKTKVATVNFFGNSTKFRSNAVVLLNKNNKLIGTRIFGGISKSFRYTRFLKILFVASGVFR